jgi:hypothetical protein
MLGANCRDILMTVAIGMAKREGSTGNIVGSNSGWAVATQHVPRFRALLAGGKTPTSCLVLYYEHKVVIMALLELCCLEVEEDQISQF